MRKLDEYGITYARETTASVQQIFEPHGYLSLLSLIGRTGPAVPCRFHVSNPSDGEVIVNFAVSPDALDEDLCTEFEITRRNKRNTHDTHVLGLFTFFPNRLLALVMPEISCSGPGGRYSIVWNHVTPEGWPCTPGWPKAERF